MEKKFDPKELLQFDVTSVVLEATEDRDTMGKLRKFGLDLQQHGGKAGGTKTSNDPEIREECRPHKLLEFCPSLTALEAKRIEDEEILNQLVTFGCHLVYFVDFYLEQTAIHQRELEQEGAEHMTALEQLAETGE